ncbi:outer membrane protein assembly factor BamC [Dentiradicibacter hellwigii]|uniref:Outer membrane protein assembly factor BamC n=1 Tax=Dentiradicibacter hellwigii TaxID=3149053 RepID=A0ABV4UEM7_9RHOO
MKVVVSRVALYAAAGILAGCSTFQFETKKIDYKSASSNKVSPLEIPPDLTSPTRDNRYVIPENGRGATTFSQYASERAVGQPSEVLPNVEKIRIERSGSQRWLVVAESPDKLWDQIKDFWREIGFVINVERPEAGVMETDWAENRAKINQDFIRNMLGKVLDSLYSTPERDKFRTRLEPGSEPGTTDIFISHRGMYEIFTTEGRDTTRWQPRPADPDLEAEMLRRLMVRLGSDQKRAETELAAAKANIPERVRLVKDGGAGTLEMQEAFDRAWRRVGLALDRVGFTVEDRDRSNGLYFVRYVDPEAAERNKPDGGLLSKLAFWRSSAPPQQTAYRIQVKTVGAATTVQVLSGEGGADQSDTAKQIIRLLFEQLK